MNLYLNFVQNSSQFDKFFVIFSWIFTFHQKRYSLESIVLETCKHAWTAPKDFPRPGKSQKIFVLTYIVALIIFFPKWAHFSLNSKRLPRYGSTKTTHFHAFPAYCIGKWAKFEPKFNLTNCLIGLQVLYLT